MFYGEGAARGDALGIACCGRDGALVAVGKERDAGGAVGQGQQPRFNKANPVEIGHRHDRAGTVFGQPTGLDAPSRPSGGGGTDRHRLRFGGRADAVTHHQDDAINL